MTATETSPALPVTPLADLLGDAPRTALRGCLTPHRLDAPQREWSALTADAAVHDLGWLRRVAVRGEDRFRWLSGMVTNTVSDLGADSLAWNLVLNAQGRIQGDLYVARLGKGLESDALELEIAADQAEKLLAHLDRFIIMDDVELVPLLDSAALGLTGPKAAAVLTCLGLPVLPEPLTLRQTDWNGSPLRIERSYGVLADHYALWIAPDQLAALWTALREAGAAPVGAEALEALRIAEAIPLYGLDIVERDLPQETSQMRALHFTKGCYLGQEIVERIRSRGAVHRRLRQIVLDGPLPPPGTELFFTKADGSQASAGHTASAVELPSGKRPALAMIRAEAELRPLDFAYAVGENRGSARILTQPARIDEDERNSN